MREISGEVIRQHRVLLASPQFGGNCDTIFSRSVADLALICGQYGIALGTCFIYNEALISRARNRCVKVFKETGVEHLLFIDADIGFRAQNAIELLILQIQNSAYDIIGGAYRKKQIDPAWAFNSGPFDPHSTEPVEVDGIGTGFMLIRREVFAKFDKAFPDYWYNSDQDEVDGGPVMQYFHAEIDYRSRRYLSEDYWFCARCAEIGISTWLCPWMKLRHAGKFVFE